MSESVCHVRVEEPRLALMGTKRREGRAMEDVDDAAGFFNLDDT
jgi:hypothetical protein